MAQNHRYVFVCGPLRVSMEPKARVVYKVWDLLEKLLNQTKLIL